MTIRARPGRAKLAGRTTRLMCGAVLVLVAGAALVCAAPAGAAPARPPASRVLVVSLPDTTWRELTASTGTHGCSPEQTCPYRNLHALLRASGVADLSSSGVASEPTVADGYLTISAGARAQSRTGDGRCAASGARINCPDIVRLIDHNDDLLYDAHVGALGDRLARAGIARAVVGSPEAALALAGRDGSVPTAALDEFDRVWRDRSVVLVEAPPTGLAQFDHDLGSILERVDPTRDAVLVVGPGGGRLKLTVAGLRAPTMRPGLMRSAFTRHAGIVAIVDVAPTILDLVGIKAPAAMEGRAFEPARTGGSYDDRVDWLADTNDRALFRDRAITQAGGIFAAATFTLLGLATLLFLTGRIGHRRCPAVQVGALTLLFFLPATYLAVPLPFASWGLPAYWLFVGAVSVAAALAVYWVTDRAGLMPLLVALGAIVLLIVVDVFTGARLQFDAAFGYSPTIGGRYAGLGNLGYAQLAAAGVLLAGLVAHRIGGRAGAWWATGILAVALVADGAPYFGADVGGVLSMLPAFGVTVAMLFGWRFRWRLLALFGVAAVALLALLAAIDLARPADSRSHLGRVLGGNGGDLWVILRRKLDANLAVLGSTRFTFILVLVYGAVAYLVYRSPGPLRVVRDRIPELTASLAGLGIVAVLGTLLNDSGIAITGMMLGVLVPVLVVLCLRVGSVATEEVLPEAAAARAMSGTQ